MPPDPRRVEARSFFPITMESKLNNNLLEGGIGPRAFPPEESRNDGQPAPDRVHRNTIGTALRVSTLPQQAAHNKILAGLHHLLPHLERASVLIEKYESLFSAHRAAMFVGESQQMRKGDFCNHSVSILSLRHEFSHCLKSVKPDLVKRVPIRGNLSANRQSA